MGSATTPEPGRSPVLEVDDLSVELGGLPVLRGISLQMHPGQAVALLGGNGSGKSTLVRAALGLLPHQRGAVRLFGTDLAAFRSWRRLGYVPQRSAASAGGARVREVVASGRLALRRPFAPQGRRDREAVASALDLVGLGELADADVRHLSGGQQQRTLIARALAGEPDLLVLDEPTAGVDLDHQRALADVIGSRLESGMAALVVLHEVGPLAPLIDRAVVLREGRVVHDGELGGMGRFGPAGRHEHTPAPEGPGWWTGAGLDAARLDGTGER